MSEKVLQENIYKIQGIEFSRSDLKTISLDQLMNFKISPGHVFYFMKTRNQFILVLRAGDVVHQEFISKYQKLAVHSFFFLPIANATFIDEYSHLWQQYKKIAKLSEQRIFRDKLIKLFATHFWGESQESLLTLIIANYKVFNRLPSDFFEDYFNTSTVLYQKALISASILPIVALANNIFEFDVIQDMYTVALGIDYGLVLGSFSTFIIEACEYERTHPGEGLKYLEEKNVKKDVIESFRDHPYFSLNYLETQNNIVTHPEMLNIVKYHHELVDGSGFPQGFAYSCLSPWDVMLSFVDNLIPYKEMILTSHDGNQLLKKYILEINEKMFQLPVYKIMNRFKDAMDWAGESVKNEEEIKVS